MTVRWWLNLAVGFTAFASAACASSGTGGSTAKVSESSREKVTSVEIAATPAASAYDLVNRLRPQWLRSGGPSSIGGGTIQGQVTLVYLDGTKIGAIDALRSISASGIKTMEWVPAARASIVFSDIGSDALNGVISIKTR